MLQTLKEHEAPVLSVAFSPDGAMIATTSTDNTVKLWSRGGEEALEGSGDWEVWQTLDGHGDWILNVTFSPDGQEIAIASEDNTVKLWNIDGQVS